MDVKNPFLFDEPSADASATTINPFLNGGPFEYSETAYMGINPFSDQPIATNGNNIFGDYTAYPSDMNPFGFPETANIPQNYDYTQPMDLFGTGQPNNLFETPSQPPPVADLLTDEPLPLPPAVVARAVSPPCRPPPPRPPPPSKETKDLIKNVIGALEATTDTLHDKLQYTRTPSPNPDIRVTPPIPDKERDHFGAIFGRTIELTEEESENVSESLVNATTTQSEEQDLFGDSFNQKPKTNQDIMNLYKQTVNSAPAAQVDLLSDEFVNDQQASIEPPEPITDQAQMDVSDVDMPPPPPLEENAEAIEAETADQSSGISVIQKTETLVIHDMQITDDAASQEQVSDKSDTDLTIIEAANANMSNQIVKSDAESSPIEIPALDRKSSLYNQTESDLQKQHYQFENDKEQQDVYANTEETVDHNQVETSQRDEFSSCHAPDDTTMPEHPVIESNQEHQYTNENNAGLFGNTAHIQPYSEGYGDSMFGVPDNAHEKVSGIFGDVPPSNAQVSGIFGDMPSSDAQVSGIFGDVPSSNAQVSGIFGDMPSSDAQVSGIFGDVPSSNAQVSGIFGDMPSSDAQVSGIFGDVPSSNAQVSGIFGDMPSSDAQVSGIFGDVPTTGFSIFGDPIVPSGADSVGAALFDTTAPAPNVGMSLFGGSNEPTLDIFAESEGVAMVNPFAPTVSTPSSMPALAAVSTAVTGVGVKMATDEEFDAFSARFDSATVEETEDKFDAFSAPVAVDSSPCGGTEPTSKGDAFGFGDTGQFDSFLAMAEPPPVPQSTPRRQPRQLSGDSDEGNMTVVIRPANLDALGGTKMYGSPVPILAPPPAPSVAAFTDSLPSFNPFDRGALDLSEVKAYSGKEFQRTDSQETPPTPLYEEDQSQPLEPFPRTQHPGHGWEMHLRQPNKKKITGQRFWKKVYVALTEGGNLQLSNTKDDKEPFQELPLQACYSVSDISAQQFDQFGKIFTVKVQYMFYKERPGMRPGQFSKAERLTSKLSKFAQHAIAGDYDHVKEFASDVKKLGMPVEHAPQISQLLKLGTHSFEDLKMFSNLIEEHLFRLTIHRDRALNYKSEEVQITSVDEIYVEQDMRGVVLNMVARVRVFFLAFLSGMPDVDLGVNDMRKQGCEVVGRHDIMPVITEEWIRLEAVEFHCCVNQEEFEKSKHIKFKPPDACYIELMRFRIRPPKNRELPLQVKTKMTIQGRKVEILCDILVPGFSGRKLGQVPCEDVSIRFPIPECWIYMFRVEKHFRYGSVKAAHRRTGKVKGIERFMGTVETAEAALMEVTSGQAKYEHQHKAIVWRMSRLPKEGQGAYTSHQFVCKMVLTAYDQMPENLDKFCYLEFTMPATTVSHCVMRSISIVGPDEPPEKYARYLARSEYKIEVEFSSGTGPASYIAATQKDAELLAKETAAKKQQLQQIRDESSSDSD